MTSPRTLVERRLLGSILRAAETGQHAEVLATIAPLTPGPLAPWIADLTLRHVALALDRIVAAGGIPDAMACLQDITAHALPTCSPGRMIEAQQAAEVACTELANDGTALPAHHLADARHLAEAVQRADLVRRLQATLKAAEGGVDLAALREGLAAAQAGKTAAAAPIALRWHDDRERERSQPPVMIVAGLLPLGGVGALVALPGVGKTLVASELTRCVAAGAPFLERSTLAGRVIYACPDSPASTERRLLALPAEVGARIATVMELALPAGIDALRSAIQSANASGDPVRLVVIDTWDASRTHTDGGYAGQDGMVESILGPLRRLAVETALAVLVLHHCTRGDNGRARGSLVFDARVDWIATIEAVGSTLVLTATKNRDGERGPIGAFQIASEVINGASVPVLVPVGSGPRPALRTPPADREGAVLAILARHQGEMTKRALAEQSGVPEGSILRPIDRLRTKGLVECSRLMVSAAGLQAYEDSLLALDQGLDQGGV